MNSTEKRYPDTQLHIGGEWRDGSNQRTLAVINPATGAEIGLVACATTTDLDLALSFAQQGFLAWSRLSPFARSTLMRVAAQLLRERCADIAKLLTQEQGKPIGEALIEVKGAADVIDWFAEEGTRVSGRVLPQRRPEARTEVLRMPVGPVAAFTPWNFPITQVTRKLGAALATGCSIIVKAPEETPAAPAALIRAFVDAGVPSGVVQLVFGEPAEISTYLVKSPVIKKITFTGSTEVGKHLASLAGSYMKRCTMELGGHAPVIVAQDADIELAAFASAAAKFRNAGQVCISPTRFLVHKKVADAFTHAFLAECKKLVIGNGLDATVNLGPLANSRRVTAMQSLVRNATAEGATLALGGSRIDGPGNFFEPTVLLNCPLTADVFNTEPFGPVAAMRTFEHLGEAIIEANRVPFGLSSYAFTESIGTARALAQHLDVGMLWVNQGATPTPEIPFGGVKDSGYGSEGGTEALDCYLSTKSVTVSAYCEEV